ncbi:MAG: hypothetical protein WCP21_00195, partial [Armatimonadota bacterium]
MKRVLVIVPLLLTALAFAQDQPKPPATDLAAEIPLLRVARTLKLRQPQVDQVKGALQQVAQARTRRQEALDAIAAEALTSLTNVDNALIADRRPVKADLNAAEKAAREHKAARAQVDKAVDDAVEQVLKILDRNQTELIETVQQERARDDNRARFNGADNLAEYLSRYIVAMRQLLPDEYESLRVAMGLRLAGLLVAPSDQRYNAAVADVLRVLDTVRRMTDAEFSQREGDMTQAVARALRLADDAAGPPRPVSRADFFDFVASPFTLQALESFEPAPPLE